MRYFVTVLSIVCVFLRTHIAFGNLWNPSTDPLPPLQPKECSFLTYNTQKYYNTAGGVVLDIEVAGYEFSSYYYKSIQSMATGSNFGVPVYQLATNNYTSQKSMPAQYNTQTCTYGEVEGGSSFLGYDYYQNLLLGLYSSGVPVYYEVIILPTYGLCYKYYATVPWDNPALPRNIVYTVIFQASTGYLISYDLTGTEYCCGSEVTFYCPNSGLCNDGTAPQLTYCNTNQTISEYQIYATPSLWPKGFFNAYCPFTSTATTSDDDDHVNKLKNDYFILFVTFVVLFGVTLCILLGVIYHHQMVLQQQQGKQRQTSEVSMNAIHA